MPVGRIKDKQPPNTYIYRGGSIDPLKKEHKQQLPLDLRPEAEKDEYLMLEEAEKQMEIDNKVWEEVTKKLKAIEKKAATRR